MSGKDHHWVCVVDDKGKVLLSRKLVNDEQPIRALVTEVDELADTGNSVRYLAGPADLPRRSSITKSAA